MRGHSAASSSASFPRRRTASWTPLWRSWACRRTSAAGACRGRWCSPRPSEVEVRRLLARASASVALRWTASGRHDRVTALTGIPASDWRRIAQAFPELPPDPGPRAADRREKLHGRASRALATGGWKTRLDGEPPALEPALYVSAHIGALQALRYSLRARSVPAASVIGRFNLDRTIPARTDPIFDRRFPMDFPHALASTHPHRLRSALKRGSLIVAADMPARESRPAEILGGRVLLDPRPFRLAWVAGVECR